MSDRDIDRSYAIARSQRRGNNLATIDNVGVCPTLFSRRSVRAAQQGLGAAYCGNIEEESQMGCQAEATGMGYSLPIDNQQVRAYVQLPARRENQRRLTEREESRHVRPVESALGRPHLDSLQAGV